MTDDEAIEEVQKLRWEIGLCSTAAAHDSCDALARVLELARAQAAHQGRQVTHSDECWRWHLGCATKEVERLRALFTEPSAAMVEAAVAKWAELAEEEIHPSSLLWVDSAMHAHDILRAAGRAALGENAGE